uniref:ferroptosis suppressor protein 1-like n=1 Tax=Styela clava TaxID=7725 RepID=UPI00193AABBD|nr:ferroptosis suppressor protein 1-like [Styela clava]
MGGGASKVLPEDTQIVVVGGGFAGIRVALDLLHTGKVKLIDPKDSLFYNLGALRSCVEPSFANYIYIPYQETFGDAFLRGKVVKINKDANTVTLDDGQDIPYTHLVLATGGGGPFPAKMSIEYPKISKEEGLQLYKDINKEILESDTIVCVGGGAVGVELSGELKTDFPDKRIILIHSNEVLCSNRLKAGTQSKLQALVKRKGIELMLNERVSNLNELQINKCTKDQVLKTESGKEIKVDLVFRCTGVKLLTDDFKDALGDAINDRGQVKVDQFLKVEGTDNIFALGDITNVDEEKMLVTAYAQGASLSNNLFACVDGRAMKPYKSGSFGMAVPVGRDAGVAELGGIVFGDMVTRNIKSDRLFIDKTWRQMKQKLPKV